MIENLTEAQLMKLNEIEDMNLPLVWRQILQVTGPDLFIKIWRIVSTPELSDTNKIYVPSIKKYYEFQRVQITKSLIAKGKTCADIIKELNCHGISTSPDTIKRIAKKYELGEVKLK